jgi:membrane protease YdiL (CAAX protease family)
MTLKAKIAMFAFYNVFVITFASMTGQWLAALYFFVSLASKAVYSRSIDAEKRLAPVAAGIAMLLLSTFLVVFGAQLLADWFPFPPEVKSARPSGQSGLFVDTPQTLMAWGMIYFTLMTLCELAIFRKSVNDSRRALPTDKVTAASR